MWINSNNYKVFIEFCKIEVFNIEKSLMTLMKKKRDSNNVDPTEIESLKKTQALLGRFIENSENHTEILKLLNEDLSDKPVLYKKFIQRIRTNPGLGLGIYYINQFNALSQSVNQPNSRNSEISNFIDTHIDNLRIQRFTIKRAFRLAFVGISLLGLYNIHKGSNVIQDPIDTPAPTAITDQDLTPTEPPVSTSTSHLNVLSETQEIKNYQDVVDDFLTKFFEIYAYKTGQDPNKLKLQFKNPKFQYIPNADILIVDYNGEKYEFNQGGNSSMNSKLLKEALLCSTNNNCSFSFKEKPLFNIYADEGSLAISTNTTPIRSGNISYTNDEFITQYRSIPGLGSDSPEDLGNYLLSSNYNGFDFSPDEFNVPLGSDILSKELEPLVDVLKKYHFLTAPESTFTDYAYADYQAASERLVEELNKSFYDDQQQQSIVINSENGPVVFDDDDLYR